MRSKHPSRPRTRTHSRDQNLQLRPGGTRFDYLSTSPPPVRSSSPVLSHTSSPTPEAATEQQAHALSLELFGANAKATDKRDWADDDVPSTLFSPGRLPLVLDVAGGSTPGRKDTGKQPHNASVFVGSLPPDSDEAEIAQHLAQHLSRFAKVQSIKIVHDSKGGLCAFVQCENATQAAQLVSQARTNPQPFMGRYLRYENARAHRTLWISYRTPMCFLPCSSDDEVGAEIVTDDNGVRGRWIELDLPDALRISKPRDARFPIVTLRGEARNIPDTSRFDKDIGASGVPPAFRQKGVLFTDLKFDSQTIKTMAEAFGPLESFKVLTSNDTREDPLLCPPGHKARRSLGMDASVWEIKWEHRDDCITALNTLGRIAHLSVTWAKESGQLQSPRPGFPGTPISPHFSASHITRETSSPVARGRPFLLLDCTPRKDDVFRGVDSPLPSTPYEQSPKVASRRMSASGLSPLLMRHGKELPRAVASGDEMDEGWTFVRPQQGANRRINPSLSERMSRVSDGMKEEDTQGWNEGDFPPLRNDHGLPTEVKKTDKERAHSTVISLDDSASANTDVEQPTADGTTGGRTPILSRPHINHRRSLSNPVDRPQLEASQTCPGAQRVEILPTPDPASTSRAPTPTSGRPGAQSPVLPDMMAVALPQRCHQEQKLLDHNQESEGAPSESEQSSIASVGVGRREHRRQATVDPKTVFVGGLEPYGPRPWDETRLREIFEKYGVVQKVHIVSPSPPYKKAGFAFVTFADEQSAARAVCEEHNRVYDRRQIRVQIRDMFPQRGGFKYRGRGMNRRPLVYGGHIDNVNRQPNVAKPNDRVPFGLANGSRPFGQQLAYACGIPSQVDPRGLGQLAASTSTETESSTLHSLNSFDAKADVDSSHETDSKTAVSASPPPTISTLPTSVPGFTASASPQGVPSAQFSYFTPHSWASSPYGVQMHYPMPYGSYGGITPPASASFTTPGQSADPTSDATVQWGHMYRPPLPFAPYPYVIVPPASTDTSQSATVSSSQSAAPLKGQPPLHATAFIQGERGVLFPVYQPEALSNYMHSSSPPQSAAASHPTTMGSSPAFSGQQQTIINAAPAWPYYPQGPQYFAYPVPPVGITSAATPPSSAHQQAIHNQAHNQLLHASGAYSGSSAAQGLSGTGGMISGPQPIYPQRSSGAGVQSMPPVYFIGSHPGTTSALPAVPRNGSHASHASHAVTPERPGTYYNKYPPRRDPAFHHGRGGGQYSHNRGSDLCIARSPSTVRPTSVSMNTHVGDPHSNSTAFQQRQRSTSAAPPLQLGFNMHVQGHIQDGGQAQQQQWTGLSQ